MALDPMMLAQQAGPPPGGMGGPGLMPPGPQDPGTEMAMRAMGNLGPKPSGSASIAKAEEAFDYAYKLVMAVLPQLGQWNPKAARDAHAIARQLLAIRSDIRKEVAPQPPPNLAIGMGMGGTPGVGAAGPGGGGFGMGMG